MRIKYRIYLGYIIILGLCFIFLIGWFIRDIRPQLLRAIEETLVDMAVILSSGISNDLSHNSIETSSLQNIFDDAYKRELSAQIYNLTKDNIDTRVYVTNIAGIVIFDSYNKALGDDYAMWNDVYLTLQGEYGARSTRSDPNDPYSSIIYSAAAVYGLDKQIIGVVSVGKPARNIKLFIAKARINILVAGSVVFLLALLSTLFISSWITAPVNKLTLFARAKRENQKARFPELGKGEIRELGMAFKEMSEALEGKKYVEHYVETLTHEIKGPLSSIQGAGELLQEDMPSKQRRVFIDNILNENQRIKNIAERLLLLSLIENRVGLQNVEKIELKEIINECIKSLMPSLTKRNISIQVSDVDHAVIKGEKFLIQHALQNVLQNSINFTPNEGSISISLKKKNSWGNIIVRDNGDGIPDYAITKVIDKFFSLTSPATGKKSSGLGLSFVKKAVDLHNGNLTIENNQEGGVTVIISFPLDS